LLEKYEDEQANKLIKKIAKVDLLILDELGYIPFEGKEGKISTFDKGKLKCQMLTG